VYENVGSHNNDLPAQIQVIERATPMGTNVEHEVLSPADLLGSSSVVVALTELSATAPLKNLAKVCGFRGATLPGFTREMIPALSLDYAKVNARVLELKERMDRAERATVHLSTGGQKYTSHYDLRYRSGIASGGLMREPQIVGNLPSGEAYVAPYEGERPNEPSSTSGILPVQFGDEVVLYRLESNMAIDVESTGKYSDAEKMKLKEEPAYGNIAELGIGVLGEWGVKAIGSTLLDEKLGLHIAFGRSDHIGGVTGPASFRNPKNVIHIDRIYVPSVQPLIDVDEVVFEYPGGTAETILRAGTCVV
jgi:leucyl aminopeptidase (aminopeptidase T)